MAEENVNIKVTVDATQATAAAQKLADAVSKTGDASKELGTTGKSAFEKLSDGIKSSFKSFLDLTKAFLANPIGIVIAAVTALIGYLSQFEAVTMAVSSVVKTLSAVFDGLVANAGKIASIFGDILTGDWSGAAAGISEVATAIEKQASAAYGLAAAQDALDEAQTSQIVNLAKLAAAEDELLVKAKNKTLADEERIALLKEAQSVAKESADAQVRLAEQELAVAQQRLDATTKGKKEYDDLARAAAEAEAKVISLRTTETHAVEKAQNQIDQINEAAQAKREAAEEKRKAAAEKAEADRKAQAEREAAEFEKQVQKEIEAAKKLEEEKKQIAMRDAQAREEAFKTALSQEQAYQLAKAQLAIDAADTPEAKLAANLAYLAEKQAQESLALQTQFDTKDAYDKAQTLLDEQYALKRKELLDQEVADAAAAEEAKRQEKLKTAQDGLNTAQQFITLLSNLEKAATDAALQAAGNDEKKKEKIRKESFERQKKIAIVNAIIGGALAIIQGFAQLGPIGGAIAAVLIGTTTAIQVETIAKQTYEGASTSGASAGGGGNVPDIGAAVTTPSIPNPQGQDFNPNVVGQAGSSTPQGGGNQNNPVQVFVLESDITNSQTQVSVVQAKATWP